MANNSDGSIVLSVTVDKSGLDNALKQLKSGSSGMNTLNTATKSVTSSLKGFAKKLGIAFSVTQIAKFSNEASKLASQQEASLKRLSILYGEYAKDVFDFVNANANAFGMAKSVAYEAAADYGNIFRVFADGAESAQLTNKMLQATAVIASQTGRTYEDVFEKIRSGLYGNTRAIDDLGITIRKVGLQQTQAFKTVSGGVKKWNDLTDAELQHARALGIIEQAEAKYGNTVLQTTALTRSQFNAAWIDFKATWGAAINIVLMPVLKILTQILNAATAALSAVLKFFGKEMTITASSIQGLSGGSSEIADNISKAVDNQSDLTKRVKGTNKELKKTLAGFDELQILQDNTSNVKGGGSGGGVSTPSIEITDTEDIDTSKWDSFLTTLREIRDIFLSGFWKGFGEADFSPTTEGISEISTEIQGILSDSDVQAAASQSAQAYIFSFGQVIGSISSVGATIASTITQAISTYLSENSDFIKERLIAMFDLSSKMSEIVGNIFTAFANIFSVFAQEKGVELTANIIGIFVNSVLGVQQLELQMGTDFINFLCQPIIDNQEKIKTTLEGVLSFFSDTTEGIKSFIDNAVEHVLTLYSEHISPLIQSITDAVSEMVGFFLDNWNTYIQPLLDQIGASFKKLVEEDLKPMFDKISEFVGSTVDLIKLIWDNALSPLLTSIYDIFLTKIFSAIQDIDLWLWGVVEDVIHTISGLISSIMDILTGIIDFITGVFTGNWKDAWDGLVSIFKGILNVLITEFEGVLNLIIDALNLFVGALDGIVGKVGDLVGADWSIPKIPKVSLPRLAKGAVIPANHEFLAVLGEQKHGTNIEAPAELIKQMAKEAIVEMGGIGNQNQVVKEEHYNLNETELMTIVYKLVKGGERLNGTSLVKQGGI